jgi:anaerobic selenocysteine-containing dehydrogenase
MSDVRTIRGACPLDCPDTCSWIVTVKDGNAVGLRGDPDHPFTRGALCNKVADYLAYTRSPNRLLHPMRRVGRKGGAEFTRISWDEALEQIAHNMREAIASHGAESIWPFNGAGSMGLIQGIYGAGDRFWNAVGASRHVYNLCTIAGGFATGYTLGDNRVGMDPETFRFAKLILLWGANVLSTHPHMWRPILDARKNGALVVTIDPIRTRTAIASDRHLAPIPGTDAALALGLLHVVLAEGKEDRRYIDEHTLGWEAFRRRILEFPPSRAASVTGLSTESIVELGKRLADNRPPPFESESASSGTVAAGWLFERSRAFLASPATGGIRAAARSTTRADSSASTGRRCGARISGRGRCACSTRRGSARIS